MGKMTGASLRDVKSFKARTLKCFVLAPEAVREKGIKKAKVTSAVK